MKGDSRLDISQGLLVGIPFADNDALQTKWIGHISIWMLLNNNLELLDRLRLLSQAIRYSNDNTKHRIGECGLDATGHNPLEQDSFQLSSQIVDRDRLDRVGQFEAEYSGIEV